MLEEIHGLKKSSLRNCLWRPVTYSVLVSVGNIWKRHVNQLLVRVEDKANTFNELKLNNLAGSRLFNKSVNVVCDLPVGPSVDKSSGQLIFGNTNDLVKETDQQTPKL